LSDEEQWETTAHGHRNGHGFDRPLEYAEAKNEFDTAIAERDAIKAEYARVVQMYDPQIQAKREADREKSDDELFNRVIVEPNKFRADVAQVVQQAAHQQAMQMRADETFRDVAETHGEEAFKAAYSKLHATGAAEHARFGNSATVREILHSPNPGRAMMNLARGGGSTQSSGPPFMPGMQRNAAPRGAASHETMDHWDTRRADYGSDQDIMNYALRR
jgi:hypothetical protein